MPIGALLLGMLGAWGGLYVARQVHLTLRLYNLCFMQVTALSTSFSVLLRRVWDLPRASRDTGPLFDVVYTVFALGINIYPHVEQRHGFKDHWRLGNIHFLYCNCWIAAPL